jgi:probable phosphoglycerate mutase
MKIYLVRHCEYANPDNIMPGRLPVELSEEGLERAGRLRKYFADKDIGVIYSSAVRRCKQTAEIISAGKIAIVYDQRLLETFSAYQGYNFGNRQIDWRLGYRRRDKLGGESFAQVQQRGVEFWDWLVENESRNVIICSHGDPLYGIYLHLLGKPPLTDEEVSVPGDYIPKGGVAEVEWQGKLVSVSRGRLVS